MYNNSANEMLMGGGVPSMKFDAVGTSVTGTIAVEPKVEQQRDYTSGELLTWEDGSPRQQIRLVLDTDLRDPADPYDEGQRALYVKSGLMKAVRTAIRASGAKGLEVGGKLTVTYTGDGEPTKRGMHPPKLYSAAYQGPVAPGMEGLVAPQAAPAPQAPAPAAPKAPVNEQAAALAQLTQAQIDALGYTPAQLAALGVTPAQQPPF